MADTAATIARIVAEHWRDALMDAGPPINIGAHPLACVLAALDGEDSPAQLGIRPTDPDGRRITEVARG